jgi:hypothetical protein
LVENPEMTATQVLERAAEKGALMSPTMGRQQSEFLGTCIERELDILNRAGNLPEVPQELLQEGSTVAVQYQSPLARFQNSGDAAAFSRTMETVGPLAQVRPEVLDNLDVDECMRMVSDALQLPPRLLLPPEEVAKLRETRAKQAAEQKMLDAAPGLGAAAKNFGQAMPMLQNMGG